MASGSVIKYEGARGVVWRVKFRDSTGAQVMKSTDPDGNRLSSERQAERALGVWLREVERTRWRKPDRLTFDAFADRFEQEAIPARGLKPSTAEDYEAMLRVALRPYFGDMEFAAIEPEDIDAFIAAKTKAGLSGKTIRNYLGLLSLMFKTARRWKLVSHNPTEDAALPKSSQTEAQVLDAAKLDRLLKAYRELSRKPPEGTTAAEWEQARRLVTLAVSTGVRRGEALALRWSAVELLEGKLTIRETYSRGRFGAPKSAKSMRTILIGSTAVETLKEQYAASRYKADSDLVFCHPQLGTPLDPSNLSKRYLRPALDRAGIDGVTGFHSLRHTALTAAAAAGLGPHYVQALAGHSSVAIGERYVHLAAVAFPGAADKTEARLFGAVEEVPHA